MPVWKQLEKVKKTTTYTFGSNINSLGKKYLVASTKSTKSAASFFAMTPLNCRPTVVKCEGIKASPAHLLSACRARPLQSAAFIPRLGVPKHTPRSLSESAIVSRYVSSQSQESESCVAIGESQRRIKGHSVDSRFSLAQRQRHTDDDVYGR